MDPLSLTSNVITVLQLVNSIVTVCYEVRASLKKAPWSLTRVLDEIKDLRNVLENIERVSELLDESGVYDAKQLRTFSLLCEPDIGPLARCHQELVILEEKILSSYGSGKSGSKRRAFLQVMSWQLKENEAEACLQRIDRCKNTILLAMTADEAAVLAEMDVAIKRIDSGVSEIMADIQTKELDEKERALTRWLAPADSSTNHDSAVSAHQIGTSNWFIESKEFMDWSLSKSSCLWLSGFPGSGKTILFANTIMSLTRDTDNQLLLAFFYCDFRKPSSQSAINVIGSLVAQICSQIGRCPEELKRAFDGSKAGSGTQKRPSFTVLRDVLLSLSRFTDIVLLIDAVDECAGRKDLLDFLVSIQQASQEISILVTSRDEVDIREALTSFTNVSIENHTSQIDEDIEYYIEHRLSIDPRLQSLQAPLKRAIKQSLKAKSGGMFRLVQCTLDNIATLRTVRSIRSALEELPKGLGEMYSAILSKVPKADVSLVRKILLWLSFTVLPLTLEELHSAIAIEQGSEELDHDSRLASTSDILGMCGSLITISEEGYVQLAHLSVKDYLVSDEIREGPAPVFALSPTLGKLELAVDCFTYLSFLDFRTGPCQSAEAFATRLAAHPFLRHASTAWTYYLRGSDDLAQLDEKIINFFSPQNRQAFMSWVQVLNADSNFKWDLYPQHATPLYYAASFGLLHIVKHLIDSGAELDSPGSRFGGTALHGAVFRYHTAVSEALLKAGANPNRADFDKITPLHTASGQGHVESMKLLLEHGALKEARDRGRETPMDWAVKAGQKEAQALLAGGAAVGKEEENVLQQVWKRCIRYMPNWYEQRSGLESSIIISVTIGGEPLAAS